MSINEKIKNAKNLNELCEILNSWETDGFYEKIDEEVDIANLPTFGGDVVDDTCGIWSWDDERLLVSDEMNGCFKIIGHDEY